MGLKRKHTERRDETIEKKYGIIYADPPWKYTQKRLSGAAEHHYRTMSIEELCALPVADQKINYLPLTGAELPIMFCKHISQLCMIYIQSP